MSYINKHLARREFLKQSAVATALGGTPFAANLMAIGAASAQTAADYKSLVCVFLNGGNDHANTILPVSNPDYLAYANGRLSLSLPVAGTRAIAPTAFSGPSLAMHPAMGDVAALFNSGKCAVVANVGTLVQPITKAQWNNGNGTTSVPSQLFSHSDQQGAWQTGLPDTPSTSGWLGRIGDLIAPAFNAGSNLSICMSVAGNNLMQSGVDTIQYQITTQGPVKIYGTDALYGSQAAAQALKTLLTQQRSHMLEQQLNTINARAIASESTVNTAIGAVNPSTAFAAGNPVAAQLKMVARLIGARQTLGQRRQIFFVSAGGYDFHDNLLGDQTTRLAQLNAALKSFYDATVELGVANTVTTFTASDFGRALLSNGRGTDHGWGGHHFVMGGAVQGGRIYGAWPTVSIGGPEDAGQGRLIPTTAVDQYAASFARWMGVTDANQLRTVLPNVERFATNTMNFV
jgi:uncharacterized protein (DUF1501 family)